MCQGILCFISKVLHPTEYANAQARSRLVTAKDQLSVLLTSLGCFLIYLQPESIDLRHMIVI